MQYHPSEMERELLYSVPDAVFPLGRGRLGEQSEAGEYGNTRAWVKVAFFWPFFAELTHCHVKGAIQ